MSSLFHAPSPPAAPRRLPMGEHVAPFLSANGNPVLLSLGRGGWLWMMAELTGVRGESRDEENPSLSYRAEPAHFVPAEERLLGRGIYVAPWRIRDGIRDNPKDFLPVVMAIDARHRLVATMTVTAKTTVADVRRDLETLLEVWDAAEAERDAARPLDEAKPLTLAENLFARRWRSDQFPRGVYKKAVMGGARTLYSAVTAKGDVAAEIETHQHDGPVVRALRAVLDEVDPQTAEQPNADAPEGYQDSYDDGHETDRDDHCGESWKDGTIYDKRKRDE